MSKKISLLLLPLAVLFNFCKTAQKATDAPPPAEVYTAVDSQVVSQLTIPVNIPVADLVKGINQKISGVLYEDYSFDDNGGDGLMLKAMKAQDISLFLSGQTLKYRVPLSIWMKKKLVVGAVDAAGDIALNFKTDFQIRPDWTIGSVTYLEYHEWLKRPAIKTGLGDIGIEGIANLAISRSQTELTRAIDRMVAEQMSLRPHVQTLWEAIQTPSLLSPEYQMWVKTTPISIAMTPLETTWKDLRARIMIECHNDVTFGEKPNFRENTRLPELRLMENVGDDFKMLFETEVPFAEAEKIARQAMVGQVLGEGKQKIRVENIELFGAGDLLAVNTQLSGAFNGKIYFTGKPVFNASKNQIEVADLDFHLQTKNLLHRSATWILKGVLKNQIKKAMVFPLEENIMGLKKSVQETLNRYEIQPGVVLTGSLDDVRVLNTAVKKEGLAVRLFSAGRVNVDVSGL